MKDITDKHFVECLNHIAATAEGRVVLAYLKDTCGWDKTYLSTEDPQVTQYHAARRGVYGGLRLNIRPQHLKEIEFNYQRKAVENERSGNRNNTRSTSGTKRSDRTDTK